MKILYSTTATATGDGRNGHTATEDGMVDVDVRTPPELGGAGGATNPEQLFAAGYAACFHSAMKLVAKPMEIDTTDSAVSVTAGLGMLDSGAFSLALEIDVHVPNATPEQAQQLVERAHEVCPYSNATRGNVEVKLGVI
ncbi:MAG TPA: organic hydroperoxide resistance protein [Acidimicrobiales bacterium]|nr:organic hydroperoxide resistance protein [Acidimicrobiales bacterium]